MSTLKSPLIGFLAAVALTACTPAPPSAAASATAAASPAAAGQPSAADDSTVATPADGNALDDATLQIIKGSVGISASAVACGMGTKTQADAGIARARTGFVERGFSGDAYDRAAAAAYKDTAGKFSSASASEKAQACAQMKKFGEQMSQMGKDVQDMQKTNQ